MHQFAQNTEYRRTFLEETGYKKPWYLFYKESLGVTLFRGLLGALLLIELVYFMFVVALDQCILIDISTDTMIGIMVLELLFLFDFVLNFLLLPLGNEVWTWRDTSKAYLKRLFIIDFVVLMSNFLGLVPGTGLAYKWFIRLKLLRIFRIGYIHQSFSGIGAFISSNIPLVGKKVFWIF